MTENSKCPNCGFSMINVPLGRFELQRLFSIKRWSEFQFTCFKCKHVEPKTIVNI